MLFLTPLYTYSVEATSCEQSKFIVLSFLCFFFVFYQIISFLCVQFAYNSKDLFKVSPSPELVDFR